PLLGGGWSWSFAFWGALVLLSALAVIWLSRTLPDTAGNPEARWWPDWTKAGTWQLGLLMGGLTAAYFGANAFIPDFLRTAGRPELIAIVLAVLNVSQLPASLVGAMAGANLIGRRQPLLALAAAIFVGVGMFVMARNWAVVIGGGILGVCLALL